MPATTPFVVTAACVLLAVAGCQNQQNLATNPFGGADKVPPPATRTFTPTAPQPYLQGATTATPPATFAAAETAAPIPAPSTLQAVPLSASPETAIALPSDNQPLRIAAPAPPTSAPTPTFAPIAQAPAPQVASPEFTPVATGSGLDWGAGSAPAAAPSAVIPAAYQTPAAAPRVRLPGYPTPPTVGATQAGPVGQVQITELPPPGASAAQAIQGDGFQPRGTAPGRTSQPVTPISY